MKRKWYDIADDGDLINEPEGDVVLKHQNQEGPGERTLSRAREKQS